MALKFEVNQVPVGLEEHYKVQDNGTYHLNVEGVISQNEYNKVVEDNKKVKASVSEFRNNNITLKSQVETFTSIFGSEGVDPTKINDKINSLAEQRANERTLEMKTNYETKVSELETGLNTTKSRYSELVLGKQVQDAVTKYGVHSSAIEDVLFRANQAFAIVDDKLVYKSEKLDKDGKAFTIDTWAIELAKSAPHLFAQSQGTGATKSVGNGINRSVAPTGINRIAQGLNNASGANKPLA